MSREKRPRSEEDKLLHYVLLWISGNKEFLEKAGLPPISIKNMKLYERDTQRELSISGKGRKNVLRAIVKLESQRLIRKDNAGNVLVTKKGWLIAEGLVEGYFDLDREQGIYYLHDVSLEEKERHKRELRQSIIQEIKKRLEG